MIGLKNLSNYITKNIIGKKDHKHKEMVELKCPICGIKFLYDKRNLSTHINPCCSRKCGGIKSHIKK